jgi:RNA polymerase sigma factor (sigma-70 family)
MEAQSIVEPEHSHGRGEQYGREEVIERQYRFASQYNSLPSYGSSAFWCVIEEPDLSKAISLEVLTHLIRVAIIRGDDEGRNRIVEVIVRRTQTSNEYWANSVVNFTHLRKGEREMLVDDLYADLCEKMIRALIDPKRLFWEENFQHSLRFERQHVYQAFMRREGRRKNNSEEVAAPTGGTERIPRVLLESLDRTVEMEAFQIEDERVKQELLKVEHTDLPQLIVALPKPLQAVLWLLYYEEKTEKETAQLLGITDRTVRNRLREAFKILRSHLEPEKRGAAYG